MSNLRVANKFFPILLIIFFQSLKAQTLNDQELILSKKVTKSEFEYKREVKYLFHDRNAFLKYNPVSLFFGGLLFVYQKTISVQISATCPYEISCSSFSRQCIRKYGFLKGIPLTADRLTRCTKLAVSEMVRGVDYNSRTLMIYDDPNDYRFKKHDR